MNLFKKLLQWLKSLFNKKQLWLDIKDTKHPQLKSVNKSKLMTNKEKRNEWLKSKGYTPREVIKSTPRLDNQVSSYVQHIKTFIELKKKNKIRIFFSRKLIIDKDKVALFRNKQGIPIYRVKATKSFALGM